MKNENPLLVDTGRGFSIKWKGKFLASSRAPQKAAEKQAHLSELKSSTLYIIPRPLFGYGVWKLLEKLKDNSFLLCIEFNESIMSLCSPYYPQNFDNHDTLYIRSTNFNQIYAFVEKLGLWRFRRCEILNLGTITLEDETFHEMLRDSLNERLNSYWKNRLTLIKLSNRWIYNIIQNLRELKNIKMLPAWDGPLLLCGAGPSLEKSLDEIIQYRGYIHILAVDTALPSLSSRGIKPDGVVNLDGQFYNYLDFYHQDKSILHFSDITAFPASCRRGNNTFFQTPFTSLDFLERMTQCFKLPSIPPMGSVGLSALYIASEISSGPIITCGLDFAFIPGASHAKGTIFHNHYLFHHNRTSPDADLTKLSLKRNPFKLKGTIYSDSLLSSYRDQLVQLIENRKLECYQWNPLGNMPSVEPFDPQDFFQQREMLSPLSKRNLEEKHCSDDVEKFIFSLQDELKEIINLWEKLESRELSKEILVEKLRKMDFLYISSPFNPPEPQGRPEELTLLIRRARKLNGLIERLYSPSSVRNTDKKAD